MKGLLPIPRAAAPGRRRRLAGRCGTLLSLAVLLLWPGPASAGDGTGPPLEDGWYVSPGACPFECCVYWTWRALRDTPLHPAPRSQQVVGRVAAGEDVAALTGIVYARPVPVEVIHRHSDSNGVALAPGQRFYLLDYIGEGVHRIWLNGEARHLDALGLYRVDPQSQRTDVSRFGSCDAPSSACWWRIAPGARQQRTEWWVEMRRSDGSEGWSDRPQAFANKDACG